MTPWAGTSAALVALFTDLSKDVTLDATKYAPIWREGADVAEHDKQGFKLQLKVLSVRGVGEDETRWVFDQGTQTLSSHQYCVRSFTLQLTATARQLLDGRNPMAVLERVRTRIRRPSSLAAIGAAGLSLIRVEQALDATYTFDNKRRPCAVMDVVFTGAFTDEDPVDPGWIQYVDIDGELAGSVDSPIATQAWVPEEPPP